MATTGSTPDQPHHHRTEPPHPSKWMGKSSLIYLVRDAIESVDWPHKGEVFQLDSEQAFPSELLMTLEVYCYARGVYSSKEVEGLVPEDETLRELFAGKCPLRRTIVKFRRQHRQPIKDCLRKVFDQAFIARFGDPSVDQVPVDFCVAMALDRWFEPICGPAPESEAAERLDRAVFWDGMADTDI